MKKGIAFFDFDGTITRKDSLFAFIRFIHGNFRLYWGLILFIPVFAKFKMGMIDRQTAKEALLKYFFGGMPVLDFEKKCAAFSEIILDNIVREEAMKKIEWHKKNQHEIVLVSASPENWLRGWCYRNGLRCISTRLEITDGVITGRILGKNCYGEEKSRRIQELYLLHEFEAVYAYGDSAGDKKMLELASFPFYRSF